MEKIFKKNNLYLIILSLIFTIAIILRILIYSYDRSLWLDESFLAFYILDFNYLDYFKYLTHPNIPPQAAPALFMVMTKFITNFLGINNFSLRIIPLISSLLSLGAFYLLSKIYLNKKITKIIALIMFAFNYRILYYSQEFKQYSSDVLTSIIVILIFNYMDFKKLTINKIILVSLFLSLTFWFSHPALFCTCICTLFLIIKNIKNCKIKLIYFIFPLLISAVLYLINYGLNTTSEQFLHDSCQGGFIHGFNYFILLTSNNIQYLLNHFLIIPLLILFLIGLFLIFKKNKLSFLYIISPFVISIILAILQKYPYFERMILFLIPFLLIIIIKPFDLINKNKIYSLLIPILFILSFANYITYPLTIFNEEAYSKEEISATLFVLKKEALNSDLIYIPQSALTQFEFYNRINNLNFKNYFSDKQYEFNNHTLNTQKTLEALNSQTKFWIITTRNDGELIKVNDEIMKFINNKCELIKSYKVGPTYLFYVKKIKN